MTYVPLSRQEMANIAKPRSTQWVKLERPKVDRAVPSFLKSKVLYRADFTIREDGL
jgi:hypothetical protein